VQDNLLQKKEFLLDVILIPIIFLSILLLGNYGVFLGHNFITNEPAWQTYLYHAENMNSSGWRPDLGLGLSYFFGDPGNFHVWALFRWWNHLFPDPLSGYNTSVIALLWAGCLTQFVFLRAALPIGRTVSVFLSSLIAFGAQRDGAYFIQSSGALLLIAIPLISLILYDFSTKPTLKHYFFYTLTLTLTALFGNAIHFIQSLFFSSAFFFALAWFQGWHKKWALFRPWLGRFIILNISSGLSILILAAWAFYSIFVENQLSNYVRDPQYEVKNFFSTSINLKSILQNLFVYIQPNFLSSWSSVLGPHHFISGGGRGCFSILLPIVFLIALFHKSKNFWEFSFKYFFIGTFLYQEIMAVSPILVNNLFQYFRPPINFSSVLQVFGVLGLGICLNRAKSGELKISSMLALLIQCVALLLCLVYVSLFIVALFAIYAPESLNTLFANMWYLLAPYVNSLTLKGLMPDLILENVRLLNETMGISYLLYYGSAGAIMGLFSTRHGIPFMKWKSGIAFVAILLAHQVFLSWAVYPMNSKPPVWMEHYAEKREIARMLSPTDRIMRVGMPRCKTAPDYNECVKRKFFERELGPRRWNPGFFGVSPVLELSAPKTHTQHEVSEFIKALITKEFPESKFPLGLNRSLQTEPAFLSSKLYNITGVKYLLSQDPLEETDRMKLVYSAHQFFLYKYLGSWPYFYLADRIETISSYEDLFEAKKRVAYLWEQDPKIILQPKALNHTSIIKLHKFEFDRVDYDYESNEAEFLVISDAWHPNWRAKINGIDTKIVKANGVFKGILLPPGKGRVHLYFDNSSYRPGIWISIAGWVLFIGGWIVFSRRNWQFPTQNPQSLIN